MMYLKYVLCLLICFFIHLARLCSNSGYPFENYLSTVTPYRIVSNKSFERIEYKGCVPKKIWMVMRHGTRNPSASSIEKMNTRLPTLKNIILENDYLPNEFIKNRDLDLFRKWQLTLNLKDEKKLTHEGEEEMLLVAERMQSRFPGLFHHTYSNLSYKFYKLCDRWNKDVKKNPKTLDERNAFEESSYMINVVKEINKRLHLQDVLNAEDIKIMYTACAFETAWNRMSKSPWCSPFMVHDLKVLEYAEDLKYYWQDGYGHELTYKQACPAFKDMMSFLSLNDEFPKATIYFTHSGTLLKMLAHIGMYRETEHLTAQNYLKMVERKWRTSAINTFASNLAFILYTCGTENKILTMHQENIIRLPCCPTSDLCEIQSMKEFYSQSIDKCDFFGICEKVHL